jgi:2-polyprenyl-6-hydroxyphenyl methylase/3-demethylubiquinone-9 3-methyltransferase
MTELKNLRNHFEFGKNWSDFAKKINDNAIDNAEQCLLKLLEPKRLKGKSFLDIGCGSGLHSLAALRQGAKSVFAIDIDPVAVETTRYMLSRYHHDTNWKCRELSVFELDSDSIGKFDIVYSWGVLHHTGDLTGAIAKALRMVKNNGYFAIAVYRKTKLCTLWKIEKKYYSRSSETVRKNIRTIYMLLFRLDRLIQRRKFKEEVQTYKEQRGMDFHIDINDWLGGYPYESISPQDLKNFIQRFEFTLVKDFVGRSGWGFFGSGNDEFVFQRLN